MLPTEVACRSRSSRRSLVYSGMIRRRRAMPSATIPRQITAEQAADALRGQLGDGYKITPAGEDGLTVKHGALSFATVHVGQDQDGTATTFHVHGGGLIVTRLINELGIARTVTEAIKESLGSAAPSDPSS